MLQPTSIRQIDQTINEGGRPAPESMAVKGHFVRNVFKSSML
jgi:hypothetical protein